MTTRIGNLIGEAVQQLKSPRARPLRAVVGFDGFVDEMCGVVNARSPGGVELVGTIADFGAMVSAAAGRSFGRELEVKRVEAGGNGPNLTDGLVSLGVEVDYYGTLGSPIDTVFVPFSKRCRSCHTLGACGRTLALEFGDGKLQLNNTGRLGELQPPVIEQMLQDGEFAARCERADLLGVANWSRYPHMTACWHVLTDRVLSRLTHRPWLVVDLADPTGRSSAEIQDMMAAVGRMASTCRVVFGANLNETGALLRAIDETPPRDEASDMVAAAKLLRERIGSQMVVIHSQRRAAAAWSDRGSGPAWANGSVCIDGVYNPGPVRTTGVGDRFNAGLGAALAADNGSDPARAVAMGCAAGWWFVTAGRALTIENLDHMKEQLSGSM